MGNTGRGLTRLARSPLVPLPRRPGCLGAEGLSAHRVDAHQAPRYRPAPDTHASWRAVCHARAEQDLEGIALAPGQVGTVARKDWPWQSGHDEGASHPGASGANAGAHTAPGSQLAGVLDDIHMGSDISGIQYDCIRLPGQFHRCFLYSSNYVNPPHLSVTYLSQSHCGRSLQHPGFVALLGDAGLCAGGCGHPGQHPGAPQAAHQPAIRRTSSRTGAKQGAG